MSASRTVFSIPLLMHALLDDEQERGIAEEESADPFFDSAGSQTYWGPSGRWLLSQTFAAQELSREDGIAILTTSDDVYVSTCVSVTAFNFAQISRVVTPDTKVIVVIHEFGYVERGFAARVEAWRDSGLVVIEDCAHVIGVDVAGRRVGTFGDYALFSLPKIIPMARGGVLKARTALSARVSGEGARLFPEAEQRKAEHYLARFNYFNRRRSERAELVRSLIGRSGVFEPSELGVPYCIALRMERAAEVARATPDVEWAATLRTDRLFLPTNPLAPLAAFHACCERVRSGNRVRTV